MVVISGETGCGKTTQVPQFVLDSVEEAGEGAARVVCTQPRRISAIGVAERVAAERGELVGGTVGYQIRLERRASERTRLLFCTSGILLRRLQVRLRSRLDCVRAHRRCGWICGCVSLGQDSLGHKLESRERIIRSKSRA